MSLYFLSITPSAFGPHAYPIEVAWVGLNSNNVESHLIAPLEPWLHPPWVWSETSQERHGITCDRLCAEGLSITEICQRMNDAFAGHSVVSDYPVRDRKLIDLMFHSSELQRQFEVNDVLENVARHIENLGLSTKDFWHCFAMLSGTYPHCDQAVSVATWWREFWKCLNSFV